MKEDGYCLYAAVAKCTGSTESADELQRRVCNHYRTNWTNTLLNGLTVCAALGKPSSTAACSKYIQSLTKPAPGTLPETYGGDVERMILEELLGRRIVQLTADMSTGRRMYGTQRKPLDVRVHGDFLGCTSAVLLFAHRSKPELNHYICIEKTSEQQ